MPAGKAAASPKAPLSPAAAPPQLSGAEGKRCKERPQDRPASPPPRRPTPMALSEAQACGRRLLLWSPPRVILFGDSITEVILPRGGFSSSSPPAVGKAGHDGEGLRLLFLKASPLTPRRRAFSYPTSAFPADNNGSCSHPPPVYEPLRSRIVRKEESGQGSWFGFCLAADTEVGKSALLLL